MVDFEFRCLQNSFLFLRNLIGHAIVCYSYWLSCDAAYRDGRVDGDVITKTKISQIDSLPYFLAQSPGGVQLLFTKIMLLPKFMKSPMILCQ